MKRKLIYAAVGACLVFTSCSHDYLEQKPQSSIDPETQFADYTNAQMLVNGLGRMMVAQYLSSQGLNGEGTFNLYYGEMQGDGLQKCNYTGWSNTINGGYHQNNSNTNAQFSWFYYYRMIGNCNQILANIPTDIADNDVERRNGWDYVEAQTLTYRAYAFFRLSQMYSRRWSDRQGDSRGVILRLTADTEQKETPASSLKETYAQIYADLDRAIEKFNSCGYKRAESDRWRPDVKVAHAIYSRAALTREDWQTCIEHSQEARKGFSIMGTDEYSKGFNTPNSEWIWAAYNSDEQTIYYYSYFAYAASNSNTSNCRSYPAAITKSVVKDIPSQDTRLPLFCIPTSEELPDNLLKLVTGSGAVVQTTAKDLAKLKGDAKTFAELQNKFYNRVRDDYGSKIYSTVSLFYYLSTKFQSQDEMGVGQLCLFRAAEMYYNEAEAQHQLGNDTEAAKLLEKTVQPYNSSYTCTLTGDALFEEIKKYRKFDLQGEGFNWFDLKRWGDTLVRPTYTEGGSWNSAFKGCGPQDVNDWTFVYPQMETQYNTLVVGQESADWTPGSK